MREWDRRFPATTLGSDPVTDENALRQLIADHGYTSDRLSAVMDYLETSGDIQWWPRPYRLTKHTDQGNGPLVIASIEMRMASRQQNGPDGNRKETARERAKRIVARRWEKERHAAG